MLRRVGSFIARGESPYARCVNSHGAAIEHVHLSESAQAASSVFTLPLVGRVGAKAPGWGSCGDPLTDPHPNPSPQGGGEHTECAALAIGYSLLVTITPGAPLPAPVA